MFLLFNRVSTCESACAPRHHRVAFVAFSTALTTAPSVAFGASDACHFAVVVQVAFRRESADIENNFAILLLLLSSLLLFVVI